MFDPKANPIFDEYEIVEQLGAGGQSTVYKARHRLMNRFVALKVLREANLRDEQIRRRFRIEIEVSAMLNHPNILRAYDAREFNDISYLVMELREGSDLGQVVYAKGNLSAAEAIRLIRQGAAGLGFAHDHGVIHRDVKPSNLFLTEDGSLLVFDWGLARLHNASPTNQQPAPRAEEKPIRDAHEPMPGPEMQDSIDEPVPAPAPKMASGEISVLWQGVAANANPNETRAVSIAEVRPADAGSAQSLSWAGHIVGTPAFIAPEQARAGEVDRRADIYGLGATLFYLLFGRPMYAGNVHSVLHAQVDSVIPTLAERGDIPGTLDAIYHKMVAKDPADRYQSMKEVITALDGLAGRSKVFISYRREDSIDATDRMYEKLSAQFGIDNVFMDVDTIPAGSDFRQRLHQAVEQAAVVLVVIGNHWLTASTRNFFWRKRRLDDPNDFVRIEIEAALGRKIPVVPVLVGQAQMPSAAALPLTLRDLAFQQAAEVRPGRQFHEQLDSLIATIKEYLNVERT